MTHHQIIETIAKYLGHIIAIVCILQIYVIYYIKRNEFFQGLRGRDLTWQLLEISGIGWYLLFPMLVVTDLFGLHADTKVWASMDTIYVANLGFKTFQKHLDLKHKSNEITDSQKNSKDEQIH